MEIGTKFTFLSNGKKRNALFLEQNEDKIKAVIIDDNRFQGVNIEIHESQIINENQINIFEDLENN
jgi:hypothetical protein